MSFINIYNWKVIFEVCVISIPFPKHNIIQETPPVTKIGEILFNFHGQITFLLIIKITNFILALFFCENMMKSWSKDYGEGAISKFSFPSLLSDFSNRKLRIAVWKTASKDGHPAKNLQIKVCVSRKYVNGFVIISTFWHKGTWISIP